MSIDFKNGQIMIHTSVKDGSFCVIMGKCPQDRKKREKKHRLQKSMCTV